VVMGLLSAFYQPLFPILVTVYYYSNIARMTAPPFSPPPMDRTPMGPTTTAQPGLKFCPSCGSQIASTVMVCPNCGRAQPA
jgi:zinc ribbon protein